MKFKKILFATDLSAASETAFGYAAALARDSAAALLIAHVEELPAPYAAGELLVNAGDFRDPALPAMLEKIVPSDKSIRHEHRLLVGSPAEEIVRLAEEQQVDLIVIGTHGRSGLKRALMGSVAELVMRRAKCPVLTVKAAAGAPVSQIPVDSESSTTLKS